MKTLAKVLLLTAGLGTVALPFLTAAEVNADPAPAARAGHRPVLRALVRRQALRKHVARKLDLSSDQISQLKATRGETRTAIQAIRSDSTLTTDQKKAKAREIFQATRGKLRGELTTEQQHKLGKMRGHLRGMRRGRN